MNVPLNNGTSNDDDRFSLIPYHPATGGGWHH